jgi:ribosomal protein S18 acetylase RimI-like enzyme
MSCCATCAVPDNGAMKLELVTVQRGGRSKYAAPFDDHCGYTPGWWNRPMGEGDRTQFIQVLRDGPEVARVELDEVVGIDHYARVPPRGERALEIQFIEVKDEERRLGIGTEVVRALIARYPNRRLVAYSEGGDGFWSSLGWERYEHPTEPKFYRPLFIQPGD